MTNRNVSLSFRDPESTSHGTAGRTRGPGSVLCRPRPVSGHDDVDDDLDEEEVVVAEVEEKVERVEVVGGDSPVPFSYTGSGGPEPGQAGGGPRFDSLLPFRVLGLSKESIPFSVRGAGRRWKLAQSDSLRRPTVGTFPRRRHDPSGTRRSDNQGTGGKRQRENFFEKEP